MKTQPVIAYRIWKVSPEGRLYTAYRDSGKWPWMKPYSAACDGGSNWTLYGVPVYLVGFGESPPSDHDAPHFDCTCGLYGYKSVKCLEQTFPAFYKGNCVLGRVALWGRITEHTDGYRAEYGYPQVLYTPATDVATVQFDNGSAVTVKDTLSNQIRTAASKYGIDTAPLPEEVMAAYSQFVQKKEYAEEKARQLREAQEKMARSDGLWVEDGFKFYKATHGFLQRHLKGNI